MKVLTKEDREEYFREDLKELLFEHGAILWTLDGVVHISMKGEFNSIGEEVKEGCGFYW